MLDRILRFRRYRLADNVISFGYAFRSFQEITIPASGQAFFSAKMPADRSVVLFSRLISADRPNIRYEVYAAATGVVYGAAFPVYNMNSESARQHGTLLRNVSAATMSGPIRDLDFIRGQDGNGLDKSGETFTQDDIRIFAPGVEVFVRLVNPNTDPAAFLVYFKFFEAPAGMFTDA